MNAEITYTKKDLIDLVTKDVKEILNLDLNPTFLRVVTKSKQNYKSEWEEADFKATYNYEV